MQKRFHTKFGRESAIVTKTQAKQSTRQRRNPRQIKMRIMRAEHDLAPLADFEDSFLTLQSASKELSCNQSKELQRTATAPQQRLYYPCEVEFLLKVKRRISDREDRLTNLRSLILN